MTMTVHLPSWLLWAASNLAVLAVIFFLLRRQVRRQRDRHAADRQTLVAELAAVQGRLASLSRLWLVGRHVRGNHWDVQGIFAAREKAIAACKNARYFLFPLDLDRELPEETTVPFKLEYPKGAD